MTNNVLITGGKGFIGRRIEGGRVYTERLDNYDALLKETKDMVGIVHLAASSDKRICEANPRQCIDSNLYGVLNVLDVALYKKIWVLFISTFQMKERNLYGLTKLVGEELCRVYKEKGLNVKIFRLPIIYGEQDKAKKVVTKLIAEIQNGIEPTINTDEEFYYVYVNDIARMIELEVDILSGKVGKPYTLHELVKGIKKCLNTGRKGQKRTTN